MLRAPSRRGHPLAWSNDEFLVEHAALKPATLPGPKLATEWSAAREADLYGVRRGGQH